MILLKVGITIGILLLLLAGIMLYEIGWTKGYRKARMTYKALLKKERS